MKILVAATVPPYKLQDREPGYYMSWLENATAIRASVPDYRVDYHLLAETHSDGDLADFGHLIRAVEGVGGDWDAFAFYTGDVEYTSSNRLDRICMARNAITQKAVNEGYAYILFLDADVAPPADILPRLLELEWPITGLNVPTYALDGRRVLSGSHPDWDVRAHMNTAGCLLVARSLFQVLRWRHNAEAGMTDDPCYHMDAAARGWPTLVRHDVTARHYPEQIGPMEDRGHNREMR